jgi:2-dehydro-3-deoxyphosphogluconate aldolase/(4S)-4-hydroxy-2-oxoglutarate aldolase
MLFPAMVGCPNYLKQSRVPLDLVEFVPTGGVDEHNAGAYFDAGAVAIGVVSSLVKNGLDSPRTACDDLIARAKRFIEAIQIQAQ